MQAEVVVENRAAGERSWNIAPWSFVQAQIMSGLGDITVGTGMPTHGKLATGKRLHARMRCGSRHDTSIVVTGMFS